MPLVPVPCPVECDHPDCLEKVAEAEASLERLAARGLVAHLPDGNWTPTAKGEALRAVRPGE